jgi:membrane peptidoglycan carboxypeptidase
VSNSDVPGPYRQDPAGDYGSADYYGGDSGIGRSAGYGRGSRDDADRWGSPRPAGGRRRRTGPPQQPRGQGRDEGGWSSAVRSDRGGRGEPDGWGAPPPSGGSRGARPTGRVAQDLRDRLGVAGSRGGRGVPRGTAAGGSRGQSGAGRGPQAPSGDGSYSYQGGSRVAGGEPADDAYAPYGRSARGGRTEFVDRRYGARPGGRGGGPGGPRRPSGPSGLAPRRGPGRQRRPLGEWFRSGDWWRHWTWWKALGVAAAVLLGVPLLGMVALFIAYEQTPIPSDTTALATAAPSTVYFLNGATIGQFSEGGLNRQILTTAQIPQVMNNAIIAAEDRNFYSEGGISITGILRAAYSDVRGGNEDEGGSTLTEQFVKNYYQGFAAADNSDKNADDKLKQALVAIKLAHTKSKSWILTEYLNTVYFGENAYGVGAAAQVYFGEPASDLTISQSAMLAALANLPGYFSTDPHAGAAYTLLVARWQYVLTNMTRDNAITPAQAAAQKFPVVTLHFSSSLNGYKGYLMQMVQQELTAAPPLGYGLSQAALDTGGLKISTTFSQTKEHDLYAAVNADKQQMIDDGQGLPPYAHVGAVLENPASGAIEAVYGGPGYGVANCAQVYCELNMAEDPKQVGSSFKPYVLATAVNEGMDVQDSILNSYSPLWIPEGTTPSDQTSLSLFQKPAPDEETQPYLEFNEPSEDYKSLSVQKAAALSSDPAFEDLAHRAGVQSIINLAKEFGVGQTAFTEASENDWTALNDQFGTECTRNCPVTAGSVAIALGEGELTAVEQASLFATLADNGIYHTPHVVASVIRGGVQLPTGVVTQTVLTPAAAADVDFALSADNVPGGTAYPDAVWPGYEVIGKTGTTQTAQDAWFIGAIPQQALAVTMFTNEQDSVSSAGAQTLDIMPDLPGNATGGYGGAWPAYIWHSFMTTEFETTAPEQFMTPDYTNFVQWNEVGTGAPQAPVKKRHRQPFPTTSPCAFTVLGQQCQPGTFPTAGPTTGIPIPSPSTCVPTPGNPCIPGEARRK